ncbi:hypothetical protein APR08_004012 [Nocardia amikacinitolerans]|nr:hypothetical protein [Nocardia amikacinitolerans]
MFGGAGGAAWLAESAAAWSGVMVAFGSPAMAATWWVGAVAASEAGPEAAGAVAVAAVRRAGTIGWAAAAVTADEWSAGVAVEWWAAVAGVVKMPTCMAAIPAIRATMPSSRVNPDACCEAVGAVTSTRVSGPRISTRTPCMYRCCAAAHPLCCPFGGAAHSAVLPIRRCCPFGGAAHPTVLPTHGAAHTHCSAHPQRVCPGGWLPTHFAYASHRHRLCEAYTRCVGPARIRFRSARVRWLAASRGRIVRVYLRTARLVLRTLCTPR